MPLERVARAPELPRHKQKKQFDLAAMAGAYLLALLALGASIAGTAVLGGGALFLLIPVVYVGLGAALCGFFVRRLAWWWEATLERVASAKLAFVWSWPWSAGKFLAYLLIDKILS